MRKKILSLTSRSLHTHQNPEDPPRNEKNPNPAADPTAPLSDAKVKNTTTLYNPRVFTIVRQQCSAAPQSRPDARAGNIRTYMYIYKRVSTGESEKKGGEPRAGGSYIYIVRSVIELRKEPCFSAVSGLIVLGNETILLRGILYDVWEGSCCILYA